MTKPPVPRTCLSIPSAVKQTYESVDAVALLPYFTFSAFHVATFIRTTVVPMVFPPTAGANGQPQPHFIAKKIQVFVKSTYFVATPYLALTDVSISPLNSLLRPVNEACRLHRTRHLRPCVARRLDLSKLDLHLVRVRDVPPSALPPLALHSSSVC